MTGSNASSKDELDVALERSPSMHTLLLSVIGFGVLLLLGMLAEAFGPAGLGFGLVVFLVAAIFVARRYRFSLRTLLITVTLLSVWLGLKIERDKAMQQTVTGLKSAGGQLKISDSRSNFPWGLWTHRYSLDFYDLQEPLTAQDFAYLNGFAPSSLKRLDLTNTGLSDENLEIVGRLTDVEFLMLGNETYLSGETILDRPRNHITNKGLEKIRQLTKLKGIDLSGLDITDDGLRALSEMSQLMWIKLNGTLIKGSGIVHLRFLRNLSDLELNGCKISSEGYGELLQLPDLNCLGLNNSGITDSDLERLERLGNLGILRLAYTNVSNEAIKQFALAYPRCKIELQDRVSTRDDASP